MKHWLLLNDESSKSTHKRGVDWGKFRNQIYRVWRKCVTGFRALSPSVVKQILPRRPFKTESTMSGRRQLLLNLVFASFFETRPYWGHWAAKTQDRVISNCVVLRTPDWKSQLNTPHPWKCRFGTCVNRFSLICEIEWPQTWRLIRRVFSPKKETSQIILTGFAAFSDC